MATSTVKVLTYNIHKGFSSSNQRFVLHQIREQLRKTDIDIIFLQETLGEHHRHKARFSNWPEQSQFEFLADQIWTHYAYGKNAIYASGHHGNAILSKYPFIEWENINVSSLRRASRSLLHGVVTLLPGGKRLHVICVHFDFVAFERKKQIDILNRRIRESVPAGDPLILAGDFNYWRRNADKNLGSDLGLNDAYLFLHGKHAKTFPSWWPALPIDRIYYRGVQPVQSACMQQHPWHTLSDHVPLYAEFEISNP